MPARNQRIYLVPGADAQPVRVMQFPLWWYQPGFSAKYGQRQIDTGNPFYYNLAFLLMGWEASAWDKHCREQFSHDPRSREPWFVSEMQRVESALNEAEWVIVESYEWESGLE